MAKRIDAETRAEMANMYLYDDSMNYHDIAEKYGIAYGTARRIICEELKAGNGIKPDQRKTPGGTFGEGKLDEIHDEVMQKKYPPSPRTSDWMDHVRELNKRKREFEQKIEHKQAELDKARQEYRDFLATMEQLMKEEI